MCFKNKRCKPINVHPGAQKVGVSLSFFQAQLGIHLIQSISWSHFLGPKPPVTAVISRRPIDFRAIYRGPIISEFVTIGFSGAHYKFSVVFYGKWGISSQAMISQSNPTFKMTCKIGGAISCNYIVANYFALRVANKLHP